VLALARDSATSGGAGSESRLICQRIDAALGALGAPRVAGAAR
jgi:hypothetical protein